MRIGVIDLGTNSIRFDIYELIRGGTPTRLYRERLMVKLGDGVFKTGYLNKHSRERTLHAFKLFRGIGDRFAVTQYVAVGTSALRDAQDASIFVASVKRETGIAIKVISGAEEARLIAQGFIRNEKKRLRGPFVLIDIGGGSTEFTFGKNAQVEKSCSLNLGVARLHQLFLQAPGAKAPSSEAIQKLQEFVRVVLNRTPSLRNIKGFQCFGSSGTIRAICKLGRKKNGSITTERLGQLVHTMQSANRDELIAMPRMEEDRVALVLAGAILLQETLEFLGVNKISTSEISLREGIIERERARFTKLRSKCSSLPISTQKLDQRISLFRHSSAQDSARRKFYLAFFDGLQKFHKLPDHCRSLFTTFTSVLPLGEVLSERGQSSRSIATLLLCSDMLDICDSERVILSHLFLNLTATKIDKENLSIPKGSQAFSEFLKLHALSRACYALEGCLHSIHSVRITGVEKNKIKVRLKAHGYFDLASLRIDALQELYKQTLGYGISVNFA